MSKMFHKLTLATGNVKMLYALCIYGFGHHITMRQFDRK